MSKDFNRKLSLFMPAFSSPILDTLLQLEHLRSMTLEGTTPPQVFYQLKSLFHTLESLGSARIEGNRTTLAQYLEVTESKSPLGEAEQYKEIANIEKALAYVDEAMEDGADISLQFIRELQSIVVSDLIKEGDLNAGAFRDCPVFISGSSHIPPDPILVPELMEDLVNFIRANDPPKFDLIKVALVHHRFGWIHPFRNGNGRTVRLLTYAMLLKYGFNVNTAGRILNPTAVFCSNRDKYYEMLSLADEGTEEGIEAWCTYVLNGILEEREKLDILVDYEQVKEKILFPAIRNALNKGLISIEDEKVLILSINKKNISASDVVEALNIKSTSATYRLRRLRDDNLLKPVQEGKRQYCLKFSSPKLIYGIIDALNKNNLIPSTLLKDA